MRWAVQEICPLPVQKPVQPQGGDPFRLLARPSSRRCPGFRRNGEMVSVQNGTDLTRVILPQMLSGIVSCVMAAVSVIPHPMITCVKSSSLLTPDPGTPRAFSPLSRFGGEGGKPRSPSPPTPLARKAGPEGEEALLRLESV